jgi:hypothetical protein
VNFIKTDSDRKEKRLNSYVPFITGDLHSIRINIQQSFFMSSRKVLQWDIISSNVASYLIMAEFILGKYI